MDHIICQNIRPVRLTREELMAGSEPLPQVVINEKTTREDLCFRIQELEKAIQELKADHKNDIEKWKDYEKRVVVWKQQVLEMVKQLKAEANERIQLIEDLKICRTRLMIKEAELQKLRHPLG